MRKLRFDVATFSLLLTGTNGAMYYLIPLIPNQGLQGFLVVFLEGLVVWLSTEEKKEFPQDPQETIGVAKV